MTYLELREEVQGNLIDTPQVIQDLTGTYIKRAVRRLERLHNFKVMEEEHEVSTTADTSVVGAVPSDWKEPRDVELDWAVSRLDVNRAFALDVAQEPKVLTFTTDADTGSMAFAAYPVPDDEYDLIIPYWRYLPELSDDADTDWFTVNADEYLTQRATYYGFVANEDENRANYWKNMALESQSEVILLDKKNALAMSDTLVPYKGAMAPRFRRT
jgi:hypothetical protein